jgi:hypothetical protein
MDEHKLCSKMMQENEDLMDCFWHEDKMKKIRSVDSYLTP